MKEYSKPNFSICPNSIIYTLHSHIHTNSLGGGGNQNSQGDNYSNQIDSRGTYLVAVLVSRGGILGVEGGKFGVTSPIAHDWHASYFSLLPPI